MIFLTPLMHALVVLLAVLTSGPMTFFSGEVWCAGKSNVEIPGRRAPE